MSARRNRRVALRSDAARRFHRAASCELLEMRRLLNGVGIVVNTTADETVDADGTTSLREAITIATETPGDDTITFDPAVFTGGSLHTITLGAEPLDITSVGGKVTIQGPGSAVLAISAATSGRGFDVDSGATGEIDAMTIRDGTGASQGGGVRNLGSLSMSNVVVKNNAVTGGAGTGGNPGGDALGGGIYNSGTLTLTTCDISNNTATGGAGQTDVAGSAGGKGEGGGIYSTGAITALTCSFDSNQAIGGVAGDTTGPTDSPAAGGFALGGALFLSGGATGTISTTAFDSNSVSGGVGGGAVVGHTGGHGGNAFGGAVDTVSSAFTFSGCIFDTNNVNAGAGGSGSTGGIGGDGRGGAIYNNGELTLLAGAGGATVRNGTVHAGASGAGANGSQSGQAYGGGIASDHFLHMNGVDVSNNAADGGNAGNSTSGNGGTAFGGGVQLANDTDITLCTISGNHANGGTSVSGFGGAALGGGIFASGGGNFTLSQSTVNNNTAQASGPSILSINLGGATATGGGILADAAHNVIDSSTIDHNEAIGGIGSANPVGQGGDGGQGLGGGLYSETDLKIVNSTVANNTAQGGAGGPGAPGATVSGQTSKAPAAFGGGNGGNGEGGGIYATSGTLTTVNTTIAYNTAAGGAGGGIILITAPIILAGNGLGQGGGVWTNTTTTMTNTIIASNNADTSNGPDIFSGIVGVTLIHDLVTTAAETGYQLTVQSTGNESGPANLGQLDKNGGPTKTILPGTGSIAIDHGDNAAAIAQFGANGTDQRGLGFPRFVGVVDIGSVEVGAPLIEVSGNDAVITNGDSTPSLADFTDFGTTNRAADAELTRTFRVGNLGQLPLDIASVNLPAGYSLIEPLSSTINAGSNDTFTVALSDLAAGTFGGNIVIHSDDPNNGTFTFAVTGTISPTIKINFQPGGFAIPDGFAGDFGAVYGAKGNGLTYGWNALAGNFARDRGLLSDQSLDTLIHTQLYGNRTWEIALPNGAYQVHMVAGDPQYFDSTYKINAEDVLLVNGKPTSGNRFVSGTATVIVTDGKLTLSNAAGAVNNKFDFVEITPASFPLTRINFQTTTAPIPNGFLADTGSVFGNRGNGFTYGWNQSATSFARDRNSGLSLDQQHDTLIHTQLYGDRFWELALPNGMYSVHVVAGDPSFTDSKYKYNVEGVLAVNGTPGGGSNHWIEGTVTVNVSDGRLTITNASGAVNNKIDYVEIEPAV